MLININLKSDQIDCKKYKFDNTKIIKELSDKRPFTKIIANL